MALRRKHGSCDCEVGTEERLDFGLSLEYSATISLWQSYSISDLLSLIMRKKGFCSEGSSRCFGVDLGILESQYLLGICVSGEPS
jgi:hypothetical protein